MRKLGMIGGMGPESTIPYYREIVYGVQNKLGGNCFPSLTIESVNVFEVLKFCEEERYQELTEFLMNAIHNLERSGADFAVLSANTPHIVFEELQNQSPIPLISIVETTCNEASRRNLSKIGLLGTIFTMTEDFFKKPFLEKHIEIVVPNKAEMELIHKKIVTELEVGIVKEETRKEFHDIISRLVKENNIQAIILGCTELPLLLHDEVSPIPCLDTMKLHIESIVNYIVDDQ